MSVLVAAGTAPAPMNSRRVMGLAWPVMISMVSYALMSAADAIFVGRLGTSSLAAIGLSVTTTWLFLALPMGLMRGVRVAAAQAVGAGRLRTADVLGWQALWLAGLTGTVVAIASFSGPWLFEAMGASPEVAALALAYFRIRALAAPLALVEPGSNSSYAQELLYSSSTGRI